jgi:hypothetical protein
MLSACGSLKNPDSSSGSGTTYLYVASGTTYAGNGVVMATPSNTVVRYTTDGTFDSVVMDYTNSPGDTPVGLVDYDSDSLLVLIENASGRRIDLVAKDGSGNSTFLTNSTALSAQMRDIFPTFDGGFLVSKTTAIEKFSAGKARITIGANPYVSAPAGSCATSTTLISRVVQGPSDNIIYAHAAASPNNKIGMISSSGYSATTNCITAVTGPTANHYPTSLLMQSSSTLFVAYNNTTGPVYEIDSYPVTATSIGSATQIYSDLSVLQGITSMVMLPDGSIAVASMASTFNTIEQFTYSSGTLTHVGSTPLIPASVYTRSVSAMLVAQ